MKLAIISDIHGNLPALKAVIKDVQNKQVDDIYCLGDLVNFAGWDNEVIDFMRHTGISCIQGNHDERVGYDVRNFHFHSTNEAERTFNAQSLKIVNETITQGNRAFLKSLPFSIKLNFKFPSHHLAICLVHSTPLGNDDSINPEEVGEELLMELSEEAGADVLIMGHTHKPFHRSVFCEEFNEKKYRHFINPGSVGKLLHRGGTASYAIIHINETSKFHDLDFITTEFHYVPYDAKKVIEHLRELGLPDYYDNYFKGK